MNKWVFQMRDVTPTPPAALLIPAGGKAQFGVAHTGKTPPSPGLLHAPELRLLSPFLIALATKQRMGISG